MSFLSGFPFQKFIKFATPLAQITRTVGQTDRVTLHADTGVYSFASSWEKFMELRKSFLIL